MQQEDKCDIERDWRDMLGSHVHEHGQFYQRLAFGVLRNQEAAADVCQQAFLKAWEQKDRIRNRNSLKPWLTRVVANESFQVLRRARVNDRAMACRADWMCDVEDPAVAVERRELVVTALADLPESPRNTVALRIMHGLSGNEVSTILGVSVSQVSRWLHEGLDLLRVSLDDGHAEVGG